MNTTSTADVETPHPFAVGVRASGLGNTGPDFLDKLVSRTNARKMSLCEISSERSVISLQPDWWVREAGTQTSPIRTWGPEPGDSGILLLTNISGDKPVQPAKAVIFAISEAYASWAQQRWLVRLASTAASEIPLIRELAAQQVPNVKVASDTAPTTNILAEASFAAAFRNGREERFEDGMENEFSKQLESLFRAYGPTSKQILARLLEDKALSDEVWAEAMRWLGKFDDPASQEDRLWLLERGLTSSSATVRDSAVLGLASMDHPSAIPYLQRAIDSENVPELREDMREVLSQLTSREPCQHY